MIITIDTGGTKTLVAEFTNEGEPKNQYRFPTPKKPSEYLSVLLDYLQSTYKGRDVEAISIAVPGIVEAGVAVYCPNLGWRDFDIASEIKKHYSCPIFVTNDADLAGLAEANSLSPVPEVCLYVTVSTGIGSGLIVNGKLTPENRNTEAGHMLLEYDGKQQQWETFASGRAIRDKYDKFAADITDGRAWNHVAHVISLGFLTLIPIMKPDVIVIGGSIGTHFAHYGDELVSILDEKLPFYIKRPLIVAAQHPEEAVLYGCYHYALSQISSKTT